MNGFDFLNGGACFIEIGDRSLWILHGEAGLEVPLERQPNGLLTPACREHLSSSLKSFLQRPAWQPRLRAWCAVGARGVSLRRLTLPPAPKSELQRLLRLQIESEFPLSPDELAWGCSWLDEFGDNSGSGRQELMVAAVRKETIESYAEVFADCGLWPIFTLAALARSALCPRLTGNQVVLEIGREHSELVSFENGVPVGLRSLPFGVEHPTALDSLKLALRKDWPGQKVFCLTATARQKEIAAGLANSASDGGACETVEFAPGPGRSAATLGLKASVERESGRALLVLQTREAKGGLAFAAPELRMWAALAALLLLGCLAFPFCEALLMKGHLSRKLAEARATRGTLTVIDRELSFLQYVRKNQSPYLDAIYLMANAAPSGTRIESLSITKRGEISMRGNLRDLQQVVQFRSKLIESGFFANVTVEEQTPTPDRQKVIVRMTAEWKPASARESLKLGPTPEEMEKIKALAKEAGGGAPPMMSGPFPMMPGMPAAMPAPGVPSRPAPGSEPSKPKSPRTNEADRVPRLPVNLPVRVEKKE